MPPFPFPRSGAAGLPAASSAGARALTLAWNREKGRARMRARDGSVSGSKVRGFGVGRNGAGGKVSDGARDGRRDVGTRGPRASAGGRGRGRGRHFGDAYLERDEARAKLGTRRLALFEALAQPVDLLGVGGGHCARCAYGWTASGAISDASWRSGGGSACGSSSAVRAREGRRCAYTSASRCASRLRSHRGVTPLAERNSHSPRKARNVLEAAFFAHRRGEPERADTARGAAIRGRATCSRERLYR